MSTTPTEEGAVEEDDTGRLSLELLRQLRREDPARLFAHIDQVHRSFVFGVEDHREQRDQWGGELRVLLNRNLVLHFVSGFNAAMETDDELPQFCVRPDLGRADLEIETTQILEEDGLEIPGVIFCVEPSDYDRYVGEALRIRERYEDWDLIPDTYYLETELLGFLNRVVLEHPTVQAERKLDFRRGVVGGVAPADAEGEREATEATYLGDEDLFDGDHFRTIR